MKSSPGPVDPFSRALHPRVRAALGLLLEAWDYAQACHRDAWDFAVELVHLEALGLTINDLRWLLYNQFVHYAEERTKPADRVRLFGAPDSPLIAEKSSFVLTAAGAEAARSLQPEAAVVHVCPFYDHDLRELWLGKLLVKRFVRPAPDQHTILSVFEEEHWAPRIDNPLSPHEAGEDPPLRLHHAIGRLNQHQLGPLIHFRGDGTGEGVRWERWRKSAR